MIKILNLLTVAFFLLICNDALSQKNKAAAKKIDSLFASYNSKTPGVAVAVLKDGKIIFKKGYGMANLDHNIPVTPKTVFNIASVSKQFTAFAIYLLKEEGKISLEDRVKKYMPELPAHADSIKIKHLLAHTSGLRDQWALLSLAGWQMEDVITTPQILTLLARQQNLNFKPGTSFNYCNTGYTLLAEIVQQVTGKTFAVYAKEKIFQPLGMNSTQVLDNHETIVSNQAVSYEKRNDTYFHKPLNVSNAGPSNVLTTVEDLSKWVLNLENPVVGNRELIKEFNEPSYLDNGKKVVLRIIDGDSIFHAKGQNLSDYKGIRMISHGGHTAGFRTFLGRYPDQQFAIISLSNDEHNERLGGRWQIADFYLQDQLKDEPARPVTANNNNPAGSINYHTNIHEFTGEYNSDEIATSYTITVQNNKLIMGHIRLGDVELKRIGENKFNGSGPHTFWFDIAFVKNDAGLVTGCSISNFGVKNLSLVKIK